MLIGISLLSGRRYVRRVCQVFKMKIFEGDKTMLGKIEGGGHRLELKT